MIARRRGATAFVAVVALLVGLFVAAIVVRGVEPFGIDQGLFGCFTRWVPRGRLPYRDLFDSKPPLLFYWYALAAPLGRDVVRAVWRLEAVWLAATMALAYFAAARISALAGEVSRWIGVATAALLFFGLWSPAWGGSWARAQAEEILALPMIAAALFAWRALERERLAFVAGALAGVCALFKIPSLAIAAAFVVTWAWSLGSVARIAKRVALLLVGVALPWSIAFAWFAAHGALHDFVEGTFTYPRHYAAFIAPPWAMILGDFARTELVRGSLLFCSAIVGLVTMHRARAKELRLVAPWIAFTLAAVVVQRQLAGYHYLLAVPALAFAAGRGVVDVARMTMESTSAASNASNARVARVASIVALGVLGMLGVRETLAWRDAYGIDAACVLGRISRDDYLRRAQQGSFSPLFEEHAAEWVRDHSSPDDGLLVWGLSPGIYALSDRHPVTRYPFHKVLLTDAPFSRGWPGLAERRARLLEAMRADPPMYVLVGRGDANGFEPTDSLSSLLRFHELNDLLVAQYHPETQIGRFVVLRRGAP